MRSGRNAGRLADNQVLRIASYVAASAAVLACAIIAGSLLARPDGMLRFEPTHSEMLAKEADIAGYASFDSQSYFAGELATYELRVIYRSEAVEPEFDGFADRISHQPLQQLDVEERLANLGSGVTEYRLLYDIQVLDPDRLGRYAFQPAILYYREKAEPGDLKSIRIDQPVVYISSYYPPQMEPIELFGLKGSLNEWVVLRTAIVLAGALALLMSASFLSWQLVHRRRTEELTEAEATWREHVTLQAAQLTNRQYLLRYERMFTRILRAYADVSPRSFWSRGRPPANDTWPVTRARSVFRRIYAAGEPGHGDVQEAGRLLESALSTLVERERLQREQEPSLASRLSRNPRILYVAGASLIASAVLLIVSAMPSVWLHPDVSHYNRAVRQVSDHDKGADEIYALFSKFGATAELPKVRSAALYNAGTFLADRAFPGAAPSQSRTLFEMLYKPGAIEELLQTILLSGVVNSQEEVVILLIKGSERLRKAEVDLGSAARIVPDDEIVLRNLELVARRKHVLWSRLAQLRELFSAQSDNNDDEAAVEQGLVNIIDAELPDEYKLEEVPPGEQPYMIFERF